MLPWRVSSIRMLVYISEIKTVVGIDNIVITLFYSFSITSNELHQKLYTMKEKERNPLQEGPLKGIGSSMGMQPYTGEVGINLGGTNS